MLVRGIRRQLTLLIVASFVYTAGITFLFKHRRQNLLQHYLWQDEAEQQIQPLVFFVESDANKVNLSPREACALESAARQHPLSPVVLFTANQHMNSSNYFHQILTSTFSNFHIETLNLNRLFEDTPFHSWHQQQKLNSSLFPIHHLSDAVRYATLYKEGGIYQDTDSISIRSLAGLINAIALESPDSVGCGVLVFEKRNSFINECMQEFVDGYNGKLWAAQGPRVVTAVIRRLCGVSGSFNGSWVTRCPGVNVHPMKTFYSIPMVKLFRKMEPNQLNLPNAYTVHLWSSQSETRRLKPGSKTVLDVLFRRYCPSSYKIMTYLGYI